MGLLAPRAGARARNKAPERQLAPIIEECYQDRDPAPPKDTDQAQLGGRAAADGAPAKSLVRSSEGTGGNLLVRFTPHTEQPQGGDRDGEPQAGRPLGIRHPRALPLPAAAFGNLEALLNPRPQPVPTRLTALGRQIGQDKPGLFIPRVPASQQRTVQPTRLAHKGRAPALPAAPGGRGKGPQRLEPIRVRRPKRSPRIDP